MRKVLAIMVKDLKSYIRSKETIFYWIAFPLLFMLFFGYLYSGPFTSGYQIEMAILNLDHPEDLSKTGEVTKGLIAALENSSIFKVTVMDLREMPSKDAPPFSNMSKGQLDAILIIEKGFSEAITHGRQAGLRVILNEENPNTMQINREAIQGFMRTFIKGIQRIWIQFAIQYLKPTTTGNITLIEGYLEALGEPITLNISGMTPIQKATQLKFFIPGIMGFIILFTGISFSAIPIADERDKGTLRRILSTPTSSWTILMGKALAVLVGVGLGIVIVVSIGVVIFNVQGLYWTPQIIVPIIILSSLNSIGIGLIISSVTKTASAASGIAVAFTIPMQFFIGLYFPLEIMPDAIQAIARVFPLTYGVEAIRKVMIYNADLGEIAPTLGILTVGALIVFALGVFAYNWASKKLAL